MSRRNESNDTPTTLKPGEQAFVDAYFANNMNATRAWMTTHPRASYESSRREGSRMLTNVDVRGEISHRLDEMAMPASEAVARMSAIARAEHFPFIRIASDGFVFFNFSDPQARQYMYLIKKIKTKRERRIEGQGESAEEWEGEWVEVELYDAKAALDTILKIHGKFVDKIDLTSGGEKIKGYVGISPDDWKKQDGSA